MTDASTRTSFWHWSAWDALTAVLVGIVSFVVSIFHQEQLWVCLLSGVITAAAVFMLVPLERRIVARRRPR